jgi:hypothetical protein
MFQSTTAAGVRDLCHTRATELCRELDRLHDQLARLGDLADELLSDGVAASFACSCSSCLRALVVAREEYGKAHDALCRRLPEWMTRIHDDEAVVGHGS